MKQAVFGCSSDEGNDAVRKSINSRASSSSGLGGTISVLVARNRGAPQKGGDRGRLPDHLGLWSGGGWLGKVPGGLPVKTEGNGKWIGTTSGELSSMGRLDGLGSWCSSFVLRSRGRKAGGDGERGSTLGAPSETAEFRLVRLPGTSSGGGPEYDAVHESTKDDRTR